MTWAFPNIPKRLLVYWGRNQPLSWLRYMTVKSFIALNPDWEVRVYTPSVPSMVEPWASKEQKTKYTGRDWWPELTAIALVHTQEWGPNDPVSEVQRSDLLRYRLLHEVGGIWCDMDVAWFKPMSAFTPSEVLPSDITAAVCYGGFGKGEWFSIGVLFGAPDSDLWASVAIEAQKVLRATQGDYQGIGSELVEKVARIGGQVGNLPFSDLYPVPPGRMERTIFAKTYKVALTPKPDVIAVHWYAGHPVAADAQNRNGCYPLKEWLKEAGHEI